MTRTTIAHNFQEFPLPAWACKTLVLGTFNPSGSNADYFYGRLRSKGGWSNKFWPAMSILLERKNDYQLQVKPGDLQSKLKVLEYFKVACFDLISSVTVLSDDRANVIGNGFEDRYLFKKETSREYNTNQIIEWMEFQSNLRTIISSWGKGSTLRKPERDQLKIIEAALLDRNIQIKWFDLPPFGRNVSYKGLADQLGGIIL